MEAIEVMIFKPAEQSAIPSDIATKIAALEEKLAKSRQVKQKMMQELSAGRVRLV